MDRFIKTICLLLLSSGAVAQVNFEISPEQWQEDLDFLKAKIESKHLSPYHFITKEEFEAAYDNAKLALENASGTDAALVLTEFAASVGDGHTYVSPYSSFHRFPIRFLWFQDKLHIISMDSAWMEFQGAQVLKFGDVNAKAALELSSRISAKGETANYIKSNSEYFLSFDEVLTWLGLSKNPGTLQMQVLDDKGAVRTLTVQLKKQDEIRWVNTFRATPLRYGSSEPLWFYKIPDTQLGYFNFSRYPSKKEVRAFAKEFDQWLRKEDISTLLIDFRDNGGGDYTKGQLILNTVKQTILSKKLNVFVAIGKATFSAGMSNASHFREGLSGKYIGQVSGARPNGYQENNSFNLPNSKLLCSYSSRFYTFSDKDTDGLIPDIPIEYDWTIFHNAYDPLVTWILNNGMK